MHRDASGRQQFLHQHQASERRNPQEVHHPRDEQQNHQHGTAADAEQPVPETHHPRARSAFAPFGNQEFERARALAQAGMLHRQPLVDAGGGQQRAAQKRSNR